MMAPLRPPTSGLVRRFTHPTNTAATRAPWLAGLATHKSTVQTRNFAASMVQAASSAHHESPYDPPSGWLFGVKPGEKYQNEGWERIFVWGFWGSCIVTVVAYAYKPDSSIQTWALEEARRRLEAEGILSDAATASDPSIST